MRFHQGQDHLKSPCSESKACLTLNLERNLVQRHKNLWKIALWSGCGWCNCHSTRNAFLCLLLFSVHCRPDEWEEATSHAWNNMPKCPSEAPVHDSIHYWIVYNWCLSHKGGNFCFSGRQDAVPSKDTCKAYKRVRWPAEHEGGYCDCCQAQ